MFKYAPALTPAGIQNRKPPVSCHCAIKIFRRFHCIVAGILPGAGTNHATCDSVSCLK